MDIRITFPHKVLRNLCHGSERSLSLETTKDLVLEAIDPDQQKLSGIQSPFARASLHLHPSSHTLSVSFDKAVPKALGQTAQSFPDFIIGVLNDYAQKIPENRSLLKEDRMSIRLG